MPGIFTTIHVDEVVVPAYFVRVGLRFSLFFHVGCEVKKPRLLSAVERKEGDRADVFFCAPDLILICEMMKMAGGTVVN